MTRDRIGFLRARVAEAPEDARARLFLATELSRRGEWAEAGEHFEAYLGTVPVDPASARMQLGLCLARTGRTDAAASQFRLAIDEALRCGHEGLAEEIRSLLDEIEG